MSAREAIARKVNAARQQRDPVDLSPEEADDVRTMIHALGKHEAKARRDETSIAAKTADVEKLRKEVAELQGKLTSRAAAVRDSFISALLASGQPPNRAVSMADQAMALRGGKR